MKKESIKPECYVVEVERAIMLATSSEDNEVGGGGELEGDWASREDYRPNRPGSTNIWDQGW